MQTIIDQLQQHVGWLNNSVQIFTPEGAPGGEHPSRIYSLDGEFLGYCLQGVFRGRDGRVVARVGDPTTVPDRPELQRFLVRNQPSAWPPVVAFESEWSSDWQSVLTVPRRNPPGTVVPWGAPSLVV